MCLAITYSGKVLCLLLMLPWLKITKKWGAEGWIQQVYISNEVTGSVAVTWIAVTFSLRNLTWVTVLKRKISESVVCALYICSVTKSEMHPNYFKHLTRMLFLLVTGGLRIATTWSIAPVFWEAAKPDRQQEIKTQVSIWISSASKVSEYICIELGLQGSLDVTHLSEWICLELNALDLLSISVEGNL